MKEENEKGEEGKKLKDREGQGDDGSGGVLSRGVFGLQPSIWNIQSPVRCTYNSPLRPS